jgi:hydrogenase expression/formation protein HypE
MRNTKMILLSHGSGGRLTHDLIRDLLLKKLRNPILEQLSDSAYLEYRQGLAFTTDSFVISPIKFPGGDIGKLAVCGTVNDLAVSGAVPEYLSLALIIEEGFAYSALEKIVDSIALTAASAGVRVVAGDIKVVERGACDKIFINTCGLGRMPGNRRLSVHNIRPADKIVITGTIAQHGLAVLASRKGLALGRGVTSDCACLNDLLLPLLSKTTAIRCMRDPTRGGLATVLNEIAEASRLGMCIEEKNIPITGQVRAACELLGMDPLYLASEGRAVLFVAADAAEETVRLLRRHPLGAHARVIGSVTATAPRRVILNTCLGTRRIIEMLIGEPLPRIC